jgi:hypothetical protein
MQRRLIIGVVLFLLLALSTACRKKGGITGSVVYYTNGKPLQGVKFEIHETIGVGIGWVGVGDSKKVGEATSGHNGEFSIDLKYRKRKKYEYTLRMLNDPSFEPDSTLGSQEHFVIKTPYDNAFYLKEDKSERCEFSVLPCVRLKAVVKDVPPYNDVQQLYIQATDSLGYQGSEIYSLSDGFSRYYFIPTDGKVYIKYVKVIDGFAYEFRQTIPAPPFGKTTFYLEY